MTENPLLALIAKEHGEEMAAVVARFIHAPDRHTYERRAASPRRKIANMGVRSDNWPPQGHTSFRANELR